MISAKLANRIWLLSQRAEYRRFLRACQAPERTQTALLKSYVHRNRNTQFGQVHGFDRIHDYQSYAEQVPIQRWTDIQPWVDRSLDGESQVLTAEALTAFEETSGTTAMAKLVPYTATLRAEFQRGVAAWISALHASFPQALTGPSYWSISPATRQARQTEQGIPIGLANDGAYFDPLARYLLGRIWAVSPALSQEARPETFYFRTCQDLLLQDKLAMLSVWSPTFFLRLDEFMRHQTPALLTWLRRTRRGQASRRAFLLAHLAQGLTWDRLFPALRLVSCWTQAQAAIYLPALQARLGKIEIQPKGLLATEGITSIPVLPQLDPVLSLRSHFYEFRATADDTIQLAHQLQKGETYEVIFTTGGGLYRYASGDLVRVTGFYRQNPALRFIGRGARQSDMVGEKLSEAQVLRAWQVLPPELQQEITCFYVCPGKEVAAPHYQLHLELKNPGLPSLKRASIRTRIEAGLCQNPYYAQALRLGQLRALTLHIRSTQEMIHLRAALQQQRQIKDGDFKLPVLFTSGEMADVADQ